MKNRIGWALCFGLMFLLAYSIVAADCDEFYPGACGDIEIVIPIVQTWQNDLDSCDDCDDDASCESWAEKQCKGYASHTSERRTLSMERIACVGSCGHTNPAGEFVLVRTVAKICHGCEESDGTPSTINDVPDPIGTWYCDNNAGECWVYIDSAPETAKRSCE